MNLLFLVVVLHLFFFFICSFWSSPPLAFAQRGFVNVSLDCGHSCPNYTDPFTGIFWKTDTSFGFQYVSSTNSVQLLPPQSLLVSTTQLTSFRFFNVKKQTKYCYTFDDSTYKITSNATYLVRATFWAGDATATLRSAQRPMNGDLQFQLLLNADVWTNVSIPIPQTEVVQKEAYVVALSSSFSVCLSGAGLQSIDSSLGAVFDTPFITSLEIRQMPIDEERISPLYMAMRLPSSDKTRAVYLVDRINYGSSTNTSVRFPNDTYDRIWRVNTSDTSSQEHDSTTAQISGLSTNNNVPLSVMQTALAKDNLPVNVSGFGITIEIPTAILSGSQRSDAYYCFYFAEISHGVNASGQRVFQYAVNTQDVLYKFIPEVVDLYGEAENYKVVTRSGNFPLDKDDGRAFFNFTPEGTSTYYGPLLSAMELYQLSDHNASSGMHDGDAAVVRDIRESFLWALESWSGDPCLPYPYDWLRCSPYNSDGAAVRIVSLSLAHKNLSGVLATSIPPTIANLTALETLDLQGNHFSGPIPEMLGRLPNLNTLNLLDNNFSGKIPPSLSRKGLNLSVDEYLREAPHPHSELASIVGGSIAGVILLISVTTGAFCLVRKHRKQKENVNANEDGNQNARQVIAKAKGYRKLHFFQCLANAEDAQDIDLDVSQVRCFTYQDIENITNSFSRKLGRGGFGDVFHGRFPQGVEVAVKVPTKDSQQGSRAFLNEVALLSRVHHRNLVKLIGYCKENRLMLVYEYMPNGSLNDILEESRLGRLMFTWRDRLRIAIGAADGLEYLHNGCTPPIIHRDVKSSNILLDATMEGKISDFGISRTALSSSTDRTVTSIVGSRGYLPPDIMNANKINEKVDVYAFGVVLLELVTGKTPIFNDFSDGYTERHITDWVKSKVEGGELQSVVDPTIDNTYNVSSIWNVIDVALMCVLPDNHERPQMNEVSSELKNALALELQEHASSEFPPNINVKISAR